MLTSCGTYSLYPWFIEVNFTFELVDCARNEDFVKSRFCSIHSTVILAGLKKIVRHTYTLGLRFIEVIEVCF